MKNPAEKRDFCIIDFLRIFIHSCIIVIINGEGVAIKGLVFLFL